MPTGMLAAVAEETADTVADIVIDNYDSATGAVIGASGGSDTANFVEGNGALTVSKTIPVGAAKTNGLCASGKYVADANGVITPAA